MKRIEAFDVARGFCVAMVVVLHATLLPEATARFEQPICRMALLLLISGALATPVLSREWSYAKRRSLDLLWLYALWTPIVLVALRGPTGFLEIAAELVSPQTHLWYIAGLALLIALAWLSRRRPAIPVAVSAAAAVWYAMGGRTGAPGYDAVAHFAVFFFLGLHGRPVTEAILARCGPRIGLAAAFGTVALIASPLPHTLITLGSAGALLFVAQGLAHTPFAEMLARFGRRTPDVYLAHGPVLIVAGRLLGEVGWATLPALVIGTIVACIAIRHVADWMGLGWLYTRPTLGSGSWQWIATLRPARS